MIADLICRSISERTTVSFHYSGSLRTVEPHALGHNRQGRLVLCGWQVAGGSGEGWRDFFIDKMERINPSSERFSSPRAGYNPNDSTLTRVICRL